ncbi:MAG: dTDP-4-dehydrorhamnose 3,5-epimerase [Sedimentisphaerales bacterium]|nr:dTDP-4-dehydrorhamnose 3,5-epimerase [Sedimentisphaerales bacterium]
MKVTQTKIPSVFVIEPDAFGDQRGWFLETFSQKRYEQAGIKLPFVQDNVSFSAKNVLRGLHFQYPHSQGKLVQVLSGEVFDAAVDIRVGSPTFGQWVAETLSADNHKQMYIPPDFAHGFCVLSDTALFSYKCTDYYSGKDEGGIVFNDPDLKIDWPVASPTLSKKDAGYPRLKDIPKNKLPRFTGDK